LSFDDYGAARAAWPRLNVGVYIAVGLNATDPNRDLQILAFTVTSNHAQPSNGRPGRGHPLFKVPLVKLVNMSNMSNTASISCTTLNGVETAFLSSLHFAPRRGVRNAEPRTRPVKRPEQVSYFPMQTHPKSSNDRRSRM
jgi:hypothetical protein